MENQEHIAYRVSRNTIITNILLSAFQFIAGLWGHSAAMLSESVNTLSDVFSTLVVMIGIKMSRKKSRCLSSLWA